MNQLAQEAVNSRAESHHLTAQIHMYKVHKTCFDF